MKLSETGLAQIKDFCGISDNDSDTVLQTCIDGAKSFILSQTGLTAEEGDNYEDLTVALQVLTYESFYSRAYTSDSYSTENPLVKQIIEQHRRNLM